VRLYLLDLLKQGDDSATQLLSLACDRPDRLRLCEPLTALIQSQLAEQQWEASWKLLQRIVATDGCARDPCLAQLTAKHPRARFERAEEAERRGEWDTARDLFAALVAEWPAFPMAGVRVSQLRAWEADYQAGYRALLDDAWNAATAALKRVAAGRPTYKDVPLLLQGLDVAGVGVAQPGPAAAGSDALAGVEHALVAITAVEDQALSAALLRHVEAAVAEHVERLLDQGQWSAGSSALARLPRVVTETPTVAALVAKVHEPSALYERAQAEYAARNWEAARAQFGKLARTHPGYRDAAARSAELEEWEATFSEIDRAWQSGRREDSLASLQQLVAACPAYKDAAARLEALQAAQALAHSAAQDLANQDWETAASVYTQVQRLLPGFANAEVLASYARAHAALANRQWSTALECLEWLSARETGLADVPTLLAHTRRLVSTVQALTGGLLIDPCFNWPDGWPYDVLRAAGLRVTPASSMAEINRASFELQRGPMTPQQRTAWDVLRDTDRRLVVDAFLVAVPDPAPLVDWLEDEAAQRGRMPTARSVARHFPDEAPSLLVLWGERAEAAELLRSRLRQAPTNASLAHQLGLLLMAEADHAPDDAPLEGVLALWRESLGYWAMALTNEAYWHQWARARAETYGLSIRPPDVDALRSRLEQEIRRRAAASRLGSQTLPDAAPTSGGRLNVEFRAELAAIRLLQTLGGLWVPKFGKISVGPLVVERLSLSDALARAVARLTMEPAASAAAARDGTAEEAVRRLRWYYSPLRLPASLLEESPADPAAALAALRQGEAIDQETVYSELAYGTELAQEDVWHLHAQARLAMAEERLAARQPGGEALRAVAVDWKVAIELARRWGGEEQIAGTVREMARARAGALIEHPEVDRLDFAVAVLEASMSVAGTEEETRAVLGEVLLARAIRRSLARDHPAALADIERAFDLLPHSRRVRDIYACELVYTARRMSADEADQALALLDRAQALVDEGLRMYPDHVEFQKTVQMIVVERAIIQDDFETALKDVDIVLDKVLDRGPSAGGADTKPPAADAATLLRQVRDKRSAGDVEAELQAVAAAWEALPDDADIQVELVQVLVRYAQRLLAQGDLAAHQQLLEHWQPRFAADEKLRLRSDYLRLAPTVRHLFELADLKYEPMARDDAFVLPFNSRSVGSARLRVRIEGDGIRISCPLPPAPSSVDPELAMDNLLRATEQVMFYGLGSAGLADLFLLCWTPLNGMPAESLDSLIRSAARLADFRSTLLGNGGQLLEHLRSENTLLALAHMAHAEDERLLRDVRSACDAEGWTWSAENESTLRLQKDSLRVVGHVWGDWFRLVTELGALHAGAYRTQKLRQMVAINSTLSWGRLALTESDDVRLICDLLPLGDAHIRQAMRFALDRAAGLQQELSLA